MLSEGECLTKSEEEEKKDLIRYEPLNRLKITTLFVKNLCMSHIRGDRLGIGIYNTVIFKLAVQTSLNII